MRAGIVDAVSQAGSKDNSDKMGRRGCDEEAPRVARSERRQEARRRRRGRRTNGGVAMLK